MSAARPSFADYSRMGFSGQRRHQDREITKQPHTFTCDRCKVRVRHDQAAAHAARCKGQPLR